MKKLFATLGVVSCLAAVNAAPAQASMTMTFYGGSACTCKDTDNWTDLTTGAYVTLSCPNTAQVLFNDSLGTTTNSIKEYSCGAVSGGTSVINDPVLNKPMVSYVTKTCPKGYVATSAAVSVKSTSTLGTSVKVAYCKKQTVTLSAETVK